ncbi:MAG: adenylate/guanylate cyclase domain-containing protein [Actinomycetota bacterium]|nr:LuxR family transcriptional regulator [Actinomycetota bacterium]
MTQNVDDPVAAARDAALRHEWDRGLELFKLAETTTVLAPEDLELMAEAAWWATHPDEAIDILERAYAAYVRSDNRVRAGYVALTLAREYGVKFAGPVSAGWFNRAKGLLEPEPEGIEHGYLYGRQSLQALAAGNLDEAIELARRVADVGSRLGDRDLQAAGMLYRGMALVEKGEVADGFAMIDEAALAAMSGELGPFITGSVYCNTINTCCEVADYGRAGEWIEAAQRRGVRTTPGDCRIHQAEILVLRGEWDEAESSARRGAEELRGFNRLNHVGEAFYQIGEVRRRIGDFTAAQDELRKAQEFGRDPQPGLSLLLLGQGKVDAAMASIKRALDEEQSSKLTRARLLPAFVEISLVSGNLEAAKSATEELESIASTYDASALQAAAHYARGAVLLVEANATEAVRTLRRAVAHWQNIDAPYEAARTKTLLAQAIKAQGDIEGALLELEAARSTFERLGAIPDLRRTEELLARETDSGTATGAVNDVKALLFTDIVKSTNLLEAIGDEAWVDLLRWHDQTLRSLFADNKGEEVDHAGDGFFVVFDDPEGAITCAVAIQRTLAAHRRTHGFAPTVRIGVHAAATAGSGGEYRGKAVHEAARIASLAPGGQILASLQSVESFGTRFVVSEARSVQLKGISKPVDLVTIDWRTVNRSVESGGELER